MARPKVLLYSTGAYIQSPWIDCDGKYIKKNVYRRMTESLCCVAEIGTIS